MEQNRRKEKILKMISINNFVSVKDIAETFNISDMTARRYLKKLDSENKLKKTHGGAIKIQLHKDNDYAERQSYKVELKKLLAKEAAKNILDNQTLIIDAGSTCYELSKLLIDKKKLTIITHDIAIANILYPYHKVYIIGGLISKEYGSTIVNLNDNFLNSIHVDLLIMSVSSISESGVLSSPVPGRAELKKLFISKAYSKILIADSSKFMKNSFVDICNINIFDKVYTDSNIDKNMYEKLINENIKINICETEYE